MVGGAHPTTAASRSSLLQTLRAEKDSVLVLWLSYGQLRNHLDRVSAAQYNMCMCLQAYRVSEVFQD